MLNTLASHNEAIGKLLSKGYAVSIDNNLLVIRDIPYLNSEGELKIGAIVSKLIFVDAVHVQQDDHQIYFCGSHPHEIDRSPIRNLAGGPVALPLLASDIKVERSFSNKPIGGFSDLFEKIESYVTIICGPAISLHGANPLTFRAVEEQSASVFKIRDTLTSRAEIGDLALLFSNDVIAIIGLGGTGSYLLDLVVKTPVKEIRAFDGDYFHVHNAFRSPGKLSDDELGKRKAEVYQERYSEFHSSLSIMAKQVDNTSMQDLEGVTFAFVCVDKGQSRAEIVELLDQMKIPFIDCGMGLERAGTSISGTIRTTFIDCSERNSDDAKNYMPLTTQPDDVYRSNIQLAELNALNAAIALIKFKQIRGFYSDDNSFYHTLFTIDSLHHARQ